MDVKLAAPGVGSRSRSPSADKRPRSPPSRDRSLSEEVDRKIEKDAEVTPDPRVRYHFEEEGLGIETITGKNLALLGE